MKYRKTQDGTDQYIGFGHKKTGQARNQMVYTETEAKELFETEFLNLLKARPNQYSTVPVGNAQKSMAEPPKDMVTRVQTFYQQADRDYCLPYSFASGLRYCGFIEEAKQIVEYSDFFLFNQAIGQFIL